MWGKVTRFECSDCGREVDLKWFGTPSKRPELGCVDCDAQMEAIGGDV